MNSLKKGKKYVASDGIEFFMCPFTDMYITAGSQGNGNKLHLGTMANDVRGKVSGTKYAYYAPCKMKCIKIYPESGQSMWQSVNKVRFANGRVDYATIMIAHDDTQDCYVGQIIEQGSQLGNMGTKGNATGVHCHIEISQSNDTTWKQNIYGNYCFNNEYDTDSCYFVDDTNILEGLGGTWKKTSDVKVGNSTVSNGKGTADQVLYKGSKVQFYGCQIADIKTMGDYTTFYAENYGVWLPITSWYRVGADGKKYANQMSSKGNYLMNNSVYTVKSVSKNPDKAVITVEGKDYSVLSAGLYEVDNS